MLNLDSDELYKLSITDPGAVWNHFAQDVVWSKPYTSVLEDKESVFPKWFVGGEINMCYNCLDRQVNEGYGNDVAVIYDSPIRNIIQKFTYQELLDKVSLLAGVFVQKCGITKVDRVMIYLPTTPEALIAILACTRIGATNTSTFGEFAPKEIAERIKQFTPKLIVTSNIVSLANSVIDYKKNIDDAIHFAKFEPQHCLVYNNPNFERANMIPNRDLDWSAEILNATPQDAVPVSSDHPLFVCYTSGTTGVPKGLVLDTGGSVVVDKYNSKYLYNLQRHEAVFAISSFSWITGQCLVYSSLLSRNVNIIYEGRPNNRMNALELLRILKQHEVVTFISLPMVMKSIRKYCYEEDLKMEFQSLKQVILAGELVNTTIRNWVEKTFKCQVYIGWGQTELNGICYGPYVNHQIALENNDTYPHMMIIGVVGCVVDKDTGRKLRNGSSGRLLLKLPLMPARASTIYRNDELFYNLYFKKYPGYYDTMDCAMFITDSIMQIMSRDDTVIQVSGTRIEGCKIEEAVLLDENLDVASIIALEDHITGFVPFGFLVPRHNQGVNNEQIIKTAIKNVAENIGELACFQKAVVISQLPKTVTGKTLRNVLELMANGKEYQVHSLAENRDVYLAIYNVLLEAGLNPRLPINF